MMSGSTLSVQTNLYRLPSDKLILLLKCLLIIQVLPEDSLEEAFEELVGINRFYKNRIPHVNTPMISDGNIRGKLNATQVRPPLVLES
jgi:hypothetical protein